MICADLLLRDVIPDKWWPIKVWAEDRDKLIRCGEITAIVLCNMVRDHGRKRPGLESRDAGEDDWG